MNVDFPHAVRALERERLGRRLLPLLLPVLLLGLWAAWALLARVPVLAVSEGGRLEVMLDAHSIESPVTGRVVSHSLVLGREVQAGEILLELDTAREGLELAEAEAGLEAAGRQIAATREEVAQQRRADEEARTAEALELAEAEQRLEEANVRGAQSADEARRAERLHGDGLVSDAERVRACAQRDEARAAAETQRLALLRLRAEHASRERQRASRLAEMDSRLVLLQGQENASRAVAGRHREEIDRRMIRAPVSGRIGEVVSLGVGTVVEENQRVGAVVPTGEIRAVGYMRPEAALGRVRPGQVARVQLLGFPWTEYGTHAGSVTGVATEAQAGRVRVDVRVEPDPHARLPIEHGLPALIEVEVERVSPATLLLRAAGAALSPQPVSARPSASSPTP